MINYAYMKNHNIHKCSLALGFSLFGFFSLCAQVRTGRVVDENGLPISGAIVRVYNHPSTSAITDRDGKFVIDIKDGEPLEVNYGDYRVKKIYLNAADPLIRLSAEDNLLDMGNQKTTFSQQTQSVAGIGCEALERNSSPRIGDALYGLLPGLTVMQRVAWNSNPALNIRGGSPLVVVDGIPRDMEILNSSEIESVTLLKDAASTALWGARGANGVILVTTKRGLYNTQQIDIDYKFGMGLPVNQPKMADSYTYAMARNEALQYDGLEPEFSDVEAIRNGTSGYPNVDWLDEALRDYTTNHQLDLTFRGGGQRLRYFAVLGYKNDIGLFNPTYTDISERYKSQLKQFQLNARINLDVEMTKFTQVNFSLLGRLYQTNAPRTSMSTIFNDLYNVTALSFPVCSSQNIWCANTIMQRNPIAQICDVGYQKYDNSLLMSNLRLKQDLSVLIPGLSAEVMAAYDMSATYRNVGTKKYQYQIGETIYGGGNEALSIDNNGLNAEFKRACFEAKLGYRQEFGKHNINTSLMYRYEYASSMGQNNTQKRQYLLAQLGYNYNSRYFLDMVVNRYGTSFLQSGNHYRTYPAISGAWLISNESFFPSRFVNLLKLRTSYGLSGYDAIGYDLNKQYWEYKKTYYFGEGNSASSGYGEGALPVDKLELQKAKKMNVGLDLGFLNKLNLTVDVFTEKRSQIMVNASNMIPSHIGIDVPQMPVGARNYKGEEVSLSWNDKTGDFSYYATGSFSYVRSKVLENGEGFLPYDNLSGKGLPVGQIFGMQAIGYFRDQNDIENSLPQNFSEVRPGDIKYRDVNGDGQIDDNDRTAIGYSSSIPEIYYGLSFGFNYKNWGLDVVLQGVSHYSKMLNIASIYWPLRNNTNISDWYLKDNIRWTEETKDNANLPRLTTLNDANNFRSSTQWLKDASFLKLRNLNVYYNLPQRWVQKVHMDQAQVYFRANNLFSIDNIKYLNCEDLTVAYPDMVKLFVGATIKF